jgi:hypothetical protein
LSQIFGQTGGNARQSRRLGAEIVWADGDEKLVSREHFNFRASFETRKAQKLKNHEIGFGPASFAIFSRFFKFGPFVFQFCGRFEKFAPKVKYILVPNSLFTNQKKCSIISEFHWANQGGLDD